MATTETYGVVGYVDEQGNQHIHYPITKADNVIYDNSKSRLEAQDAQAAIDEMNAKKTAGPSASTDAGLAAFSGTGGKTLKKAGSKGSASKGIYLDANGVPQEMSCAVNKDVPSDAKFTDTTYSTASQSAAGLMSAADKKKLDGVAENANKYTHPSYTARTGKPTANQSPAFGGTFTVSQITSDETGHVTGATDRTITMPSATATQSAAGLMSAADKKKLDGIASGANAYTHPNSAAGAKSSGLYKIATDAQGHVTGATAVQKSDITGLGIPAQDTTYTPASAAPKMDGASAAVGTSAKYAREDHVHPVDTTRAPANHTHDNYVPTSRKVNGKPLSGDISITRSDVGLNNISCQNGGTVIFDGSEAFGKGSLAGGNYSATSSSKLAYFTSTVGENISELKLDSILAGMKVGATVYIKFLEMVETDVRTISSINTTNKTIVLNESVECFSSQGCVWVDSTKIMSSIAYGRGCVSGENGAAFGYGTVAAENQIAVGIHNKFSAGYVIVGKGYANPANAFRVTEDAVYAAGSYNSSGADYAEMFEWRDRNPDKQDRIGLFVTLDGEEIRLAQPGDVFILGIVSGAASVIGDAYDDQWNGMYALDIFGRPTWEDVEVPAETMEETDSETGETVIRVIREAHTERRQKINPDYDNTQKYIPRSERPEWAAVGMMGKLTVIDDGTCEPNGWATVGDGGIAVRSETQTKYRVMSRIDGAHIRVLIL